MLSITLFRNSWFPGCSAFLFLSLHSSGKSWLDLPDTALYYSTSLWVWKEVVLGFRTLLTGFGHGLWGYVSRTGTWISAPNLLKNFLPFLKNAELSANEARFWPISRKKACCGDVKQELARNYFDIDPHFIITLFNNKFSFEIFRKVIYFVITDCIYMFRIWICFPSACIFLN